MAETSSPSTTGGIMPAGTLIFPASAKAALDTAGQSAGIWFERNVGISMPPATSVVTRRRSPYLVSTLPPALVSPETYVHARFHLRFRRTGDQQSIHRLVTDRELGLR